MSTETEFIQCPHEVIRATCAGCNCMCDPCAPSRAAAHPTPTSSHATDAQAKEDQ